MKETDFSGVEDNTTMELPKVAWQPMVVNYLGEVRQVVQGGGGKLTVVGGDPGEQRKPTGGE
jgi:hypothetical protein